MADKVVLCVGTKRGLFVFESDAKRGTWTLRGPWLKGWSVNHATVDTRGTPRILAAATSYSFGATVFTGDLGGKKFDGAKKPPVPPALPPKALKFVKQYKLPNSPSVWHVEPGPAKEKKVIYAGTAPAALFRSDDAGRTWKEIVSLTRHPTRNDWMPGAGGMCLHSIAIDPTDARRILVGISAAGVFRTDDAGKSWRPANRGVKMFEGAPKTAEVGT
jgi:hypothetical protein